LSIKSKIFIHSVQILTLILMVFITVYSIKPALSYLQGIIKDYQKELIENIEKTTQVKIEYESISPLIVDSIILNGVNIESVNKKNSIYIPNITIRYNFMNILRSFWFKSGQASVVSAVYINGGRADLDFEDEWLLSKLRVTGISNSVLSTRVEIRDVVLNLNYEFVSIQINNLNGYIWEKNRKYLTKLSAEVEYLSKLSSELKSISGFIESRGYFKSTFVDLVSQIKATNIVTNLGKLKDQKINLSINNNNLEIASTDNKANYKYMYNLHIPRLEMSFDFTGSKFHIEDIFQPDQDFKLLDIGLGSSFTGNIKGSYNYIENNFIYDSMGKLYLKKVYQKYPVNLDYNIVGNLDAVRIKNLNIYTPDGNIGYYGNLDLHNFYPKGNFYLRDIKVSDNLKLNSELIVKPVNDSFISVYVNFVESNGIKISNIPSIIYLDEKNISLQAVKSDIDGKVSIAANYNRKENKVNSTIQVNNLNLEYLDKFNYPQMIKDNLIGNYLTLNSEIFYDLSKVTYNIKKLTVSNKKYSDYINLAGSGVNRDFNFNNVSIKIPDISFQGTVSGKYRNPAIQLNVDALINDNKYQFAADIENNFIKIAGSYDLLLQLSLDDTKYLNVSANQLPINYKDFKTVSSFNLKSALFQDNSFLFSLPEFSTIINHNKLPFSPQISFSMDATDKYVYLNNLIYKDDFTPLKGSIKINELNKDVYSISGEFQETDLEKYSINSVLEFKEKKLSLNLNLKNFLLDRLYNKDLKGRANLVLDFTGDQKVFKGSGSLDSKNFKYVSDNLGVNLKFKFSESLISITDLKGSFNKSQYSVPLATYNYINGNILGKITTQNFIGDYIFNSNMAINLSVKPVFLITDINLDLLNRLNGQLTIQDFSHGSEKLFENKVFRLFNNSVGLQVYSVDRSLKAQYFHNTGEFNAKLLKPMFLESSISGHIKNGTINLTMSDINLDAIFANSFIPNNPYLKRKAALFDKLNVRGQLNIRGDLRDPLFNGLLWADSDFDVTYLGGRVEPSRLNLKIYNNTLTILPGELLIGETGKVKVDGEILFKSWIPETIIVNLKTFPEEKIPVKFQFGRILTDANAYFDNLIYYWDNTGGLLTGKVFVEDGVVYSELINVTDYNPSSVTSSNSNFEIDLDVEIGSNNKLYWPNRDIPIVNATANPGDTIKVNFKSSTMEFSVMGDVYIVKGEVDYSGEPFILTEGMVKLDLAKGNIDPYIKVIGTKTVLNDDEKQVNVVLNFEGGFFSDFKPNFSSNDPSLSQDDIDRLVGLAVVGGDNPGALVFDLADELFVSYLTSNIETGIEEITGFDDVKIKSGFLSSIFTNITNYSFDTGDNTVYNQNLSEIFKNTSLTMGNFITDDFFVKGKVGTNYVNNELKLGVDLGFTLYSPFFQVGFNMTPKLSNDFVFEPELALSIEWNFNPILGLLEEK